MPAPPVPKPRAATVPGVEISPLFHKLVKQIRRSVDDASMVVDLELTFRSVTIKNGVPIFSPKKSEKSMEIKLATRVRPVEQDQ